MKPTIIIDKNIPFIKGALDSVADVTYLSASEMTSESIKNADALIVRTRTQCNAGLLHGGKVKFIATATIGFDHIDTKYCKNHGIVWKNAPGCNAESVAQYIGSALSYWAKDTGRSLSGLTLGIVGVGHVGSAVKRMAERLGVVVLQNDPPRAEQEGEGFFVSLEDICAQADVITFHTPLTVIGDYPTFYLANSNFFNALRQKPLIINAARGGVVEESHLLEALAAGRIDNYILDCWENEPQINRNVLEHSLISTPHIAGYSADGKANATIQSVRSVSKFFHLGIDNYSVTALSAKAVCNATELSLPKQLLSSYDIMTDSSRLRSSIDTFEQQRSEYPIRREIEWVIE